MFLNSIQKMKLIGTLFQICQIYYILKIHKKSLLEVRRMLHSYSNCSLRDVMIISNRHLILIHYLFWSLVWRLFSLNKYTSFLFRGQLYPDSRCGIFSLSWRPSSVFGLYAALYSGGCLFKTIPMAILNSKLTFVNVLNCLCFESSSFKSILCVTINKNKSFCFKQECIILLCISDCNLCLNAKKALINCTVWCDRWRSY